MIGLGKALRSPKMDKETRKMLFGQIAQSVRQDAPKRS